MYYLILRFEFDISYCFFNAKFYIDYLRTYINAQKLFFNHRILFNTLFARLLLYIYKNF